MGNLAAQDSSLVGPYFHCSKLCAACFSKSFGAAELLELEPILRSLYIYGCLDLEITGTNNKDIQTPLG